MHSQGLRLGLSEQHSHLSLSEKSNGPGSRGQGYRLLLLMERTSHALNTKGCSVGGHLWDLLPQFWALFTILYILLKMRIQVKR